ncbi:MAG TPA: helix-turn-helix transcriptional regulator [Solirubrobacteraceae bacterium]
MAQRVDYEWRLRLLLAERGIFKAIELRPLLAQHGISLSESQVWRLVTGKPERLNLHVLMVLCQILDCTPNDLIKPIDGDATARLDRRAVAETGPSDLVPKPARIRPARGQRGH